MEDSVARRRVGAEPSDAFTEDQRAFFDRLITEEWDTYLDPVWNASRHFEVDRLFERISPKRIIDVGCGCGYHDVLMADVAGVTEVLGLDYSEKSIETANRVYAHPKVTRIVGDVRDDDQAGGGFDLAVSFQVIEHLADARGFLAHCARRVRPGGWVAAATPNRKRLFNRLIGLFGAKPRLADTQHYTEFTPEELAGIGRTAGLEVEGWFGYGLSLKVPKLGWNLVPRQGGIGLGHRLPSVSDVFCIIFRNPT